VLIGQIRISNIFFTFNNNIMAGQPLISIDESPNNNLKSLMSRLTTQLVDEIRIIDRGGDITQTPLLALVAVESVLETEEYPHEIPPLLSAENTPGYCYLFLFQEAHREYAAGHLGPFPIANKIRSFLEHRGSGMLSSDHYTLKFGVYSPCQTEKWLCHLAPSGSSKLRAKDVMKLAQEFAVFGIEEHDEASLPPSTAPPPKADQLVGTIRSPLHERFHWHAGFIGYSDKNRLTFNTTFDPVSQDIKEFIRFSSTAQFMTLKVRILPAKDSYHIGAQVKYAWTPNGETAPDRASTFAKNPTNGVFVMIAPYNGGAPSPVHFECPFGGQTQRLIKPRAEMGGYPLLTLGFSGWDVPGGKTGPAQQYYDVYFEAIVNLEL
jgi:hypothetical protein